MSPISAATVVPGGTAGASPCTASTTPTSSMPRIRGNVTALPAYPLSVLYSDRLSPNASTRTSAQPGRGSGRGTSQTTSPSGPSGRSATTARICAIRPDHNCPPPRPRTCWSIREGIVLAFKTQRTVTSSACEPTGDRRAKSARRSRARESVDGERRRRGDGVRRRDVAVQLDDVAARLDRGWPGRVDVPLRLTQRGDGEGDGDALGLAGVQRDPGEPDQPLRRHDHTADRLGHVDGHDVGPAASPGVADRERRGRRPV